VSSALVIRRAKLDPGLLVSSTAGWISTGPP